MAINLGSYGWLATIAIDWGFPVLGTVLGVPTLAPEAAKLVKRVLGLAPNASEATVRAAVEADPVAAREAMAKAETDAAAQWDAIARGLEAAAKVNEANVLEVNKTIRAELGKVSWWHWRHLLGYVPVLLGMETVVLFPLVMMGRISAAEAGALMTAITPILAIFAGLLGYVAQDTTSGKVAAATGQPVPGILSTAIKGITSGGKK